MTARVSSGVKICQNLSRERFAAAFCAVACNAGNCAVQYSHRGNNSGALYESKHKYDD